MEEGIRQLQRLINGSRNIVFFGGAGVSTESGIPDFRSEDGLYSQRYEYPPEYMLSHSCYAERPEAFFRFYREKILVGNKGPNAAHKKLAELERAGRLRAVVTQNIDGLHQAAGSQRVIELHGSVYRNTCGQCGKAYGIEAVQEGEGVPRCGCGGIVKPDVVLYEEALNAADLEAAGRAIGQAEVLMIGGTSLAVYPAAALVDCFSGQSLVVIDKKPAKSARRADLVIEGAIGQVLAQIQVTAANGNG